ncbi:MAG: MauE/DoxX family redox-associated membrane protein [Gemmataceae bacterium]
MVRSRPPAMHIICGAVLVAAAALKIFGSRVPVTSVRDVTLPPGLVALTTLVELALGIWLFSGVRRAGAWLATTALFGVFAIASLAKGLEGQVSCGCLGAIKVNPWATFGADCLLVAGLCVRRPALRDLADDLRWLRGRFLRVIPGTVAVLVLAAVTGVWIYGSFDAAVAALRGEAVTYSSLVELPEGTVGTVGESAVEIVNRSDHPLRITGGTNDCSCMTYAALPLTVEAGNRGSVHIWLRRPATSGRYTRKAELLTDDKDMPRLRFQLTGLAKSR